MVWEEAVRHVGLSRSKDNVKREGQQFKHFRMNSGDCVRTAYRLDSLGTGH